LTRVAAPAGGKLCSAPRHHDGKIRETDLDKSMSFSRCWYKRIHPSLYLGGAGFQPVRAATDFRQTG